MHEKVIKNKKNESKRVISKHTVTHVFSLSSNGLVCGYILDFMFILSHKITF